MERVRPQPADPGRRKSVFAEVGLIDEEKAREQRGPAPVLVSNVYGPPRKQRPRRTVRFRSQDEILNGHLDDIYDSEDDWESLSDSDGDDSPTGTLHMQPNTNYTKMYRLALLTFVFVMLLPILQIDKIMPLGVRGGVVPRNAAGVEEQRGIERREDSQVDVCKRWSGQCMYTMLLPQSQPTNKYSCYTERHIVHVRLPYYNRRETDRQYLDQ